jgi:DNA-binding NarL/FixJ family response regulator
VDLDLSFADAVVLVVLVALMLIAGRALPIRWALLGAGMGTVLLTGLVGSVAGAILAVSVLGLALAAGVIIRERVEHAAVPAVGATAGAGVAPAATTGWSNPDDLTPREVEVLELIAGGRSNQEIADELHISMATVKTHVNRVFAKTGVRDRAQAVVYAFDRGLTASPPQG